MGAFMEKFNRDLERVRRTRRDARAGRAGPHPAAGLTGRRSGGDRRAVRRDAGGPRRLLDRGMREFRPGDRDRRPASRTARHRTVSGRTPTRTCGRSSSRGPSCRSDRPVPDTEVEDLLRRLAPQVLGAVVRRYGHFDAAEDATQEALLAAATQWPVDGVPDSPRGWLITVAARRLTDLLRNEQARRRREDTVTQWVLPEEWLGAGRRPTAGAVRRHADPAVPVLSSGTLPGVTDRADPAGRRRPDHRGDRPRVPGARGRR